MKTTYYPADKRGHADHGWLNAHHSFSFGQFYNPDQVHFGALRVLNDDIIAGGGAFPTHPHDNMEIVTIPLTGAVVHKDSTGGQGIINAGDVQIMSAGSGIRHSEANASKTESLNLFQLWVFPKLENITPRYDQRTFSEAYRKNKWQLTVSPDAADNALWINQDAVFALADLNAEKTLDYNVKFKGNGVYFMVIEGSVEINGQALGKRDAVGIWETEYVEIKAIVDARLLAVEVPMYQ
jgi:redox-sensitive bicupin YhaK (pirin superfamily)